MKLSIFDCANCSECRRRYCNYMFRKSCRKTKAVSMEAICRAIKAQGLDKIKMWDMKTKKLNALYDKLKIEFDREIEGYWLGNFKKGHKR